MALGAVLGSVASAAASAGVSKLFGGSSKAKGSSSKATGAPPNFSAGGLSSTFANGRLNIDRSADRDKVIDELAARFPEQAGLLRTLRVKVAPGVSDLRRARLGEIENSRSAAIGNLRENLDRRRVLGSSFGQDAITRAEAEFASLKEKTQAETFLQEIELTRGLINEEFEVSRGEFTTQLEALNLEADLAAKLASGATASMASLAESRMKLASLESQNRGAGIGALFQPVANEIGKFVGGTGG